MLVTDLTEDDIGRTLWVKGTMSANWVRVCFEGLTAKPVESVRNGGDPYFLILRATPQPGLLHFRTPSGDTFAGLLVRSTAEVWLVEVDWAITADGQIVEIGERAS